MALGVLVGSVITVQALIEWRKDREERSHAS